MVKAHPNLLKAKRKGVLLDTEFTVFQSISLLYRCHLMKSGYICEKRKINLIMPEIC